MFNDQIKSHIQTQLSSLIGNKVNIEGYSSVGGGSINQSYRLRTNENDYFLKLNVADRFPNMFETEKKGLQLLSENTSLQIPKVILNGDYEKTSYILMDYLAKGVPSNDFWKDFAYGLAEIHRCSAERFGLDYDNYIGSLPQSNRQLDSWSEFFQNERLLPLIKMAKDSGKWEHSLNTAFDNLFTELNSMFPVEPPSLIHGDLWSGNFMCSESGFASIYDPAIYFGHREMDLGMTTLFGGFSNEFYEAYNEAFPLEKGWQERLEIANLYPLLVHVNLFGESYLQSIKSIMKQFA